jgi:hypothetical protein
MRANRALLLIFAIIFPCLVSLVKAQDSLGFQLNGKPSWMVPSDTLNKGRFWLFTGTASAGYAATLVGLNYLWYADYPRSSFHFFDDSGEWQQIDKAGHTVTPYLEAYYIMHVLRWAGVKHKPAAVYAGITAFMLQNTIEVFDGFSAEWGASLSDVTANFVGAGLMTSQELLWGEQRIRLKILPTFQSYPAGELRQRAEQLYGSNLYTRLIKDYNSLNTWVSVNPASFNKRQKHLKWLNIAFGYGAGGMYGGYQNTWYDNDGLYHDRTDIERYRKFMLSVDVDFSKIKTRSRVLKVVFGALNIVKVPAPTLEFNTKGQVLFHPLM